MKFFTFIVVLMIFSAYQSSMNNADSVADLNSNLLTIQKKDTVTTPEKYKSLAEKAAANEQAIRLKPSEFNNLPPEIIKNLEERGCTIPQTWHSEISHNVISGEFSKKGQKDWAVLCSINRASSILIFRNGSTKNASEIAKSDDINYFQGVLANNEMGFSRAIDTVSKKYIIDHYKAYGGAKPPEIDHDGINDAFVEKASVVLYFHHCKWLELQGAD